MKKIPEPLRLLVRQLAAVQAEARALGMFVDDRELVACPRCGLMEDVTFAGLLITCHESALGEDTGRRFEETTSGRFRCPKCGLNVICAPDKLLSKIKSAKRKPRK